MNYRECGNNLQHWLLPLFYIFDTKGASKMAENAV